MKRPHKFRPGTRIETAADAVSLILGGEWIYMNHKPTHPGWASGWSLASLNSFVRSGYLRRAILNEEQKT